MTQFGRSEDLDLLGLAVRAAVDAVTDAWVDPQTIDAVYLGSFLSLQRQGVLASLVARELGLRAVPTTVIEGACASAGIALRTASWPAAREWRGPCCAWAPSR